MQTSLTLTSIEIESISNSLIRVIQLPVDERNSTHYFISESTRSLASRIILLSNRMAIQSKNEATIKLKPVEIYLVRSLEELGYYRLFDNIEKHILNKMAYPHHYGKKKKNKNTSKK